jgi:hypothetical protein
MSDRTALLFDLAALLKKRFGGHSMCGYSTASTNRHTTPVISQPVFRQFIISSPRNDKVPLVDPQSTHLRVRAYTIHQENGCCPYFRRRPLAKAVVDHGCFVYSCIRAIQLS